jgi:hypothetical protein
MGHGLVLIAVVVTYPKWSSSCSVDIPLEGEDDELHELISGHARMRMRLTKPYEIP